MIKLLLIVLFFVSSCREDSELDSSDSWKGESASQYRDLKLVTAKDYAISTANPHATKAGLDILSKGGSAIDAAIAAQMVLNVVEPQSSGIGGGGFLLYYDAKTGKSQYFNGRENAPNLAHDRMFLNSDGSPKKFRDAVKGGLSVGVPGLLKLLQEAHDNYGIVKWRDLFVPAILLAEKGFEVDDRLHVNIKDIKYLSDFPPAKDLYMDQNGSPLKIGTTIKNPELANTFNIIANQGADPFYNGPLAIDIVNTVRNSAINPGYLSMSDMANYKIKKGDLICAWYRGLYKVCSMPPPSSGGITILQILGILENYDIGKLRHNSAKFIHLVSEATRLAYEDRNKYIADSEMVPISQMLDKEYLRSRSKLININAATNSYSYGEFDFGTSHYYENETVDYNKVEMPSTTHLSVIDSYGNAVALTSSIEYFFGSGLISNGFFLNNQLTDFSFVPEINGKKVANRVIPGKQPRSSMSPTFVFDRDDNLILVVGSPGGPRIIQFVAKTIINHLDFNFDIQQSISKPNFVVLKDAIELEAKSSIVTLKPDLEKMGHKVKIKDLVSGVHALAVSSNKITAGADPRRAGIALGR